MMKHLYLLCVVIHVAAGCVLSANYQKEVIQHKGGSVVLHCSCSDLHSKTHSFTWEFYRTGQRIEVLNNEHYRDRIHLFNTISPANLSLSISDLREEDQGDYTCRTEKEHTNIFLYVKGCDLVKKTWLEVTGFTGESVVLPCVCTDLQDNPNTVTWKFYKNSSHSQEIYPEQTGHHSNRVNLVSKNPPGNLSLLISHLTEEDQGLYRCSVLNDDRDVRLSVKGRRETSTQQPKKTDTTPPPEQTQTNTASPASSSTSKLFGIVAVLLLVIFFGVAFICWRLKGGRCAGNVITEGCPEPKGKQEDQTAPDVTYSTVTHMNTAGGARLQILNADKTEYARIIYN